jgi:hypothetical protein
MNKYFYYILLFSIFWYGIFLRFYDLWTPSFWIDEWYSSIVSYYAYINNFSPLTPFWNYDFSQYFFTFFQSLSFSLFWVSDFSSRLPSAIFSIFSLIIVYFFSRDLLKDNKYIDYWVLFITFLFTFSSWQIIWSREARFYELLSFFYIFSIWSLYRYITLKKLKYFFLFSFLVFLWLIFHPFCFALLLVWYIMIIYEVCESIFINIYLQKRYKKTLWLSKKNQTQLIAFLSISVAFLWYVFVDYMIRSYTSHSVNLSSTLPTIFDLPEDIKKWYIKFYLQSIFSHEGVIFITFIVSIFYFSYSLKSREFILFWLLFFINYYTITQKWFMAHTRYMFHLYGIMTILWWYILFIFSTYFDKIYYRILIVFLAIISVFYTFWLTFIPKQIYYIDYTSPKPNFKWAYDYISHQINPKIVSWFPHLCAWYNLSNSWVCKYALKVNITWDKSYEDKLKIENRISYTNTPYLEKIDDLWWEEYYFVIDDLTMRNWLNREVINYVLAKCTKVYSDLWDNNYYDYIWVYKCN